MNKYNCVHSFHPARTTNYTKYGCTFNFRENSVLSIFVLFSYHLAKEGLQNGVSCKWNNKQDQISCMSDKKYVDKEIREELRYSTIESFLDNWGKQFQWWSLTHVWRMSQAKISCMTTEKLTRYGSEGFCRTGSPLNMDNMSWKEILWEAGNPG